MKGFLSSFITIAFELIIDLWMREVSYISFDRSEWVCEMGFENVPLTHLQQVPVYKNDWGL